MTVTSRLDGWLVDWLTTGPTDYHSDSAIERASVGNDKRITKNMNGFPSTTFCNSFCRFSILTPTDTSLNINNDVKEQK